ncbi:hypothetical protein Glove_326g37 [Diversispora epigaea]|uniref:Exportin-4 n=1 Tax=Diversispora epigaea TaxID=1348612 RepID=A0A397HLP6_9GLOM|nr:hypothetical protein Glove_326g37 [Diversispora epigaea]
MDFPNVLLQIEEACADMQVNATRIAGEQIIMSFKQMPGNLEACKYVLEHTQSHNVQFHMTLAIKEAVIRDYSLYLKEYLMNFRNWLLNFCLQHSDLATYVRNQILHTISVIIKRSLEDYHDAEKLAVITDLQNFVSMGGYGQSIGIGLSNALVDEFSSTKASNVGLPWDFHKKSKDFFENTYLLPIFELALRVLHQKLQFYTTTTTITNNNHNHNITTTNGVPYINGSHDQLSSSTSTSPTSNLNLNSSYSSSLITSLSSSSSSTSSSLQHDLRNDTILGLSLSLAEKILCWDFSYKNDTLLAGTFSKEGSDIIEEELFITTKTREFPANWRGYLIHNEVLRLFFTIYKIVQQTETMVHHCRQCLIQISGLHGDIFESEEQIIEYVIIMKQEIMELINNLSNNVAERPIATLEYGPDLLSISQMTRRLLCTISLPILCKVPEISTFLHEVAQLSATCLRESVMIKDNYGYFIEDSFSTWSLEAFDELLIIWVKLVQEVQSYQRPSHIEIPHHQSTFNQGFIAFLGEASYHIAATYIDTRLEIAKYSTNDEEEESNNFKDWDTYGDQLVSIAILARMVGQRVLEKLQILLHERLTQLKAFFDIIGDNQVPSPNFTTITYIQESIHWLILISAFLLADAGEGEQPLVPDSLMRLSISQGNLGKNHDQLVLLVNKVSEILNIVSKDTTAVEINNYLSPRVTETLFWFFERWGRTYLLIDESDYSSISINIVRAFGKHESQGEGENILKYLIGKIKTNFILWNSDPDPLLQMVKLLNSYGKKSSLRNGLLHSNNFPDLLTFFTVNLDHFPQMIHNSLIQTITIITSGASDEDLKHQYFQMITSAIEKRFLAVLQRPDFENIYQQPDVMIEVQNALEMFDGLALASDYSNTQLIYSFCSKYFGFMVKLLHYYQSCPEVGILVLQFFNSFVKFQDFGELSKDQLKLIYQTIVELFESYSSVNLGKKRLDAAEEEDEPYADISTILDMLSELMAAEFQGLSFDDLSKEVTVTEGFDISSVIFYGVNIIIPLIDINMLKESKKRLDAAEEEDEPYADISTILDMLSELMAAEFQGLSFDDLSKEVTVTEGFDISSVIFYGVNIIIPLIDINMLKETRLSYQAITPLALYAHNEERKKGEAVVQHLCIPLDKFLQIVLECFLFKDFEADLLDPASETLVALICARKGSYNTLVQNIISQQTSPEIQTRLHEAFSTLSAAIPQTLPEVLIRRRDVSGFREVLFRFLMNVRGFLRMK